MHTNNYYLTNHYHFYNFTDWIKRMIEIEGEYEERSTTGSGEFPNTNNLFGCNFIEILWHLEGDTPSCTFTCIHYEAQYNGEWELFIDGYEGLFNLLWDFVYQVKAKEKSLFSDPKDINKPIVLDYAPLLWDLEKLF